MKKSPKLKATQEPVAAPTPNTVTITIKLGDKTFIGIGDTTLKALQAIERPAKIASKGTVTVEFAGQKTERNFLPVQMRRVFYSSPSLQAIHAKALSNGLKDVIFA